MQQRTLSPEASLVVQRTARGLAYEGKRDALRQRLREDKEFRRRMGREILAIRGVPASQVHSNTFLQNMSVQYQNDEYIGEACMPVVGVSKRSDEYPIYTKRDRMNVPDDSAVGTKGDANLLDESRSTDNYSVTDYALKNFVAGATLENEDMAFDEMFDLVESIMEGLALKREIRIATVVTTAANYGGNTTTLSGADQWDSGGGGTPIKNIQDAVYACWNGRGPALRVGVTSTDVWNVLSRHQETRDLFKYVTPGLVTPAMLAAQLGLDAILIGNARYDTANGGQTASYSRIWGKHFAIVRVATSPTLRNASFGYTMRMNGDPIVNQWFDPSKGRGGGFFAQVGVAETHKVVAGDTSYLIRSAVG